MSIQLCRYYNEDCRLSGEKYKALTELFMEIVTSYHTLGEYKLSLGWSSHRFSASLFYVKATKCNIPPRIKDQQRIG